MKPYIFKLCEESDHKGVVHYAIDIVPVGSNLRMSKKPYEDEKSYRRDIEQDFMYTTSNGTRAPKDVVTLSDERAQYYGWIETPAA